jgi:Zn-dependent protease/CBS domain-containing protein
MGWSWTVGKLAGIDLKIHATFVLILAWVGLIHWQKGEDAAGVLMGVVFVLALFACVVLHELGHALAARRYGIGTKDITLLPIGGVARLERMPEDPRQEIVVALAGPAVNVLIAGAIFLWLTASGSWQAMSELDVARGNLLERLMVVNIFLLAFNLLPAFPMDGGRVLRALLATRTSYAQATQTAAAVGQGMAFLFGFLGLLYNPFLVFIALFVWIGAAQESNVVQIRSALGGIPVNHAMQTHFRTIGAGDSLEQAVDLILSGSQHDFPVIEDGAVVGVLNREDVFRALATSSGARVRELMRTAYPAADSHDMLEDVFRRIQECGCRTAPVIHSGELVGLVTADNIAEFLMIQSARKSAASPAASAHALRA